jgi:DNA-binding IscR family transcriptional regulator
VTRRLVREGLSALASAGLAVEAKQGGWLLSRDPSRITLAEIRSAARQSLPFPAQESDEVAKAIQASFGRAEGAAEAALGETLESFLRRFEAAPVSATPTPEPRSIGVSRSAQKPA